MNVTRVMPISSRCKTTTMYTINIETTSYLQKLSAPLKIGRLVYERIQWEYVHMSKLFFGAVCLTVVFIIIHLIASLISCLLGTTYAKVIQNSPK